MGINNRLHKGDDDDLRMAEQEEILARVFTDQRGLCMGCGEAAPFRNMRPQFNRETETLRGLICSTCTPWGSISERG